METHPQDSIAYNSRQLQATSRVPFAIEWLSANTDPTSAASYGIPNDVKCREKII
jgi:hypothetical protein